MLKGLGLRDAPRAEVLSEALQGPPVQPVGDQLAALSQVRKILPAEHQFKHCCVKVNALRECQ